MILQHKSYCRLHLGSFNPVNLMVLPAVLNNISYSISSVMSGAHNEKRRERGGA